jgi:hypothetical protein
MLEVRHEERVRVTCFIKTAFASFLLELLLNLINAHQQRKKPSLNELRNIRFFKADENCNEKQNWLTKVYSH